MSQDLVLQVRDLNVWYRPSGTIGRRLIKRNVFCAGNVPSSVRKKQKALSAKQLNCKPPCAAVKW